MLITSDQPEQPGSGRVWRGGSPAPCHLYFLCSRPRDSQILVLETEPSLSQVLLCVPFSSGLVSPARRGNLFGRNPAGFLSKRATKCSKTEQNRSSPSEACWAGRSGPGTGWPLPCHPGCPQRKPSWGTVTNERTPFCHAGLCEAPTRVPVAMATV